MPLAVAPALSTSYRRSALWLCLAFSLLYIGITRGHFIGTDEIAVYQTTRSLWEAGNLSTGAIVNTFPGRAGRYYAQYNVGQSVAALPLYGLGTTFRHLCEWLGRRDLSALVAGPEIGEEPSRWGGDVEIFFVNLFNSFTTALLCTLFFACSLRLGAVPRWACIAAILLGLTSFVGPFSTGFLQHSSEALFLLWTLYFLFLDAQQPNWRWRLWAGVMAALALLFRFPSVVALPGLGAYLLWSCWQRRPPGGKVQRYVPQVLGQVVVFVMPVLAGIAGHLGVNYLKFETIWGKYNNEGFHTPLLKGLYAFLLSPGDSILLFSPLLVLTPWLCRHCWQRHRPETTVMVFLASSYLGLYSTYTAWHGLYSSLGPRYLVPMVPVLLLPLGGWLESCRWQTWLGIVLLAAIGFWVQLIHVAVNFASVYHYENYPAYQPPFSFLFIPDVAPVVAHSRAFLAADFRLDMWLVNVYRSSGFSRMLSFALPLLVLLAGCLWQLQRHLRAATVASSVPCEIRFAFPRRALLACLALICVGTGLALAVDHAQQTAQQAREGVLMQTGLDALYTHHDPITAAAQFQKVLEQHPTHYGATFQLAMALDRAGTPEAARAWWVKVLNMAESHSDESTAQMARARLQRLP